MNHRVYKDNQSAIAISKKINDICYPLQSFFKTTYFNFARVYNNYSVWSLSNRSDHLSNEGDFLRKYPEYLHFILSEQGSALNNGCFLWEALQHDWANNANQHLAEEYRISHGICFIERSVDYIDIYHFAGDKDDINHVNLYLNNMDLLQRFILYFHDKASIYVNEPKPYLPLGIIELKQFSHHSFDSSLDYLLDERHKFLEQTNVEQSRLIIGQETVDITRRELQCLLELIRGRTAKETAEILFVSPRTVEFYLNNVRKKLGCHKKSELITTLLRTNFMSKFLHELKEE